MTSMVLRKSYAYSMIDGLEAPCAGARNDAASTDLRCTPWQRSRGFTLIELVVVMLLLAIMAGMIVVNLNPSDPADVRQEAERLALLIQAAQQEAILQGHVYAITLERRGYHFLRLNQKGALARVSQDEVLRARELPGDMRISAVEVDGKLQGETPGIVLLPSGQLPVFTITLRKGTSRWHVTGSTAGGIKPTDPLEAHAAS
jgi:general secretion pathway protein H